jgi:hypothetical protein
MAMLLYVLSLSHDNSSDPVAHFSLLRLNCRCDAQWADRLNDSFLTLFNVKFLVHCTPYYIPISWFYIPSNGD